MKTCRLRISGKVQGVWYRASAKDEAVRLGLKGQVWNEPNGDVGVWVQGIEQVINAFIEWCHHGPPLAEVIAVDTQVMELEAFHSFDIVRYESRRLAPAS